MEGEWEETTLGEVLTLQRGFDLPSSERTPGPYPVVASTGTVGTHVTSMVGGPGVVIGRSGSLGGGQYIRSDFWPLNTTLWVKDFKGNDPRFCYYLLRSLDLGQFNAGSGVPTLNRNHIHPLPVAVPTSLSEQRSIGHILGALDDKIELNRRMSETLEAMARALFKSWFVDFEPVWAKAEGRDPGLPQSIADLFPDRLVDSELGEIPEGWEVGTLGDVAAQLREVVNPQDSPGTLFHHFSIPAYDEGRWPNLEVGESIKSVKSRVPAGAVLLSKLNPEIERVWLVDVQADDRAICSTEFIVLVPRAPFGRSYVYCLSRSLPFRQGLEGLVTGTSKSHQRARVGAVLALPIVRPPDALLRRFESVAESLLARSLISRRVAHTLAALRDALLPKLISGEIRVREAERLIGETV